MSNTPPISSPTAQAGIEVLLFALKKLVQISSKPDLVILNMGIWVRDWTATGQDYKERFQTVLQHGNYFRNDSGAYRALHDYLESIKSGLGNLLQEKARLHYDAGCIQQLQPLSVFRRNTGGQMLCNIQEASTTTKPLICYSRVVLIMQCLWQHI